MRRGDGTGGDEGSARSILGVEGDPDDLAAVDSADGLTTARGWSERRVLSSLGNVRYELLHRGWDWASALLWVADWIFSEHRGCSISLGAVKFSIHLHGRDQRRLERRRNKGQHRKHAWPERNATIVREINVTRQPCRAEPARLGAFPSMGSAFMRD